ncbi:Ig-like domain-containing protein [Massilia sp. W12]|uniref:Ig-like domain-containing protein n=1 Tax=Massilia sp. W12 TaxID=3126507 RepID=UPI0030CD7699
MKASQTKRPGFRPRKNMLALESRVVFDGAAASNIVDHHGNGDVLTRALAERPAAELAARTAAEAQTRQQVVFVDAKVKDWRNLLPGIANGVDVVVLNAQQNGLQQIADYLAQHNKVDSIQILGHGWEGDVWLGSTYLNQAALENNRTLLGKIGQSLNSGGDILLYSCNTGRGEAGLAFVDTLAALTGADVAASSNRTGAGGDWNLEVRRGAIEADNPFSPAALTNFQSDLATLTVTTNADSGAGSLRAQIAAAASGDTITFQTGMTVTLSTGQLTISQNLTIDGDLDDDGTGDVTISGGYNSRVFNVSSGTVKFDGLTITKGLVAGAGGSNDSGKAGGDGTDALGAGIFNAGTLTIVNSTITKNFASGGGGAGGSFSQSGGGGGGGGYSTGLGGTGGTGRYSAAPTAPAAGTGGNGGGTNGGQRGGYGGSTTGGLGGGAAVAGDGYTQGGNGGTASNGSLSIGGGGGGSGGYFDGGAGGNAAGGIYNSGTLTITGSSITNNLGVGGGGGGGGAKNYSTSGDGGAGGAGIGALWNKGGTVNMDAATYATMSTTNAGGAGKGGTTGGTGNTAGTDGTATSKISTTDGGTTSTTYAPAPTTTVSTVSFSADTGTSSTDFITNTASQTISGTLSANLASGEKVEFSLDNGSTWNDADTYTTGSSAWSTAATLSSSDTLKVRVANSGGSGTALSQAYVLDQSAPSISAPDMTAGTDSGSSSTDNITNDSTPTFTGTAEAGASVTLYDTDGSTSLGTATADGSGNWSITASTMSEGSHTLTAKASDTAGNVSSASSSLSVTIDLTAPTTLNTPDLTTGTDTGDANNDNITGDNTPTFNGTGEVGATVNLYDTDGSTSLGSATVNGSGKWSITTSSMTHGVHSLTLKSTDVAGNVSSASGALSITVVTTAPAVSSVAYNERTGVLKVTGTDFLALSSGNDIDASMLTFTGEGGTYTLTDTSDVELTSGTEFSLTLSATDQAGIQQILNKNGTTSFTGTTYQLDLAEGWDAGIAGTLTSSITGKAITVSGIATISSANYTAHGSGPIAAGTLTVTGTNLNTSSDTIDPTKITLQVLNGSTVVESYTLTTAYNPSTVTVDSTTQFSIVLNATDQLFINGILNNAGTTSIDGYDFNLNAASGWNTSFTSAPDKYVSTPALTNSVNVDDAASPAVTSATFNTISHVLTVTGSDLVAFSGSDNDVKISYLTLTGAGGKTYTLTSTDVDVTSATSFAVTLNSTDQSGLAALLDKDGTKASDNTTYNLSAALNWNGQIATVADTTNALTVTTPSPTVSKVIQTSGDGSYKAGDTVTFKVSFDQAVVVDDSGGTPRILLETGTTDQYATYVSGTGSADLIFSYVVQAGDTSSDLQYFDTASFDLNSGTIVSVANGSTADLTLPGTGTSNSLGGSSALVIDTTAPATPAAPDLDSGSDSGTSSSDDYTSDNTPTFSGTADANTTVYLYDTDGATVLGSATADGSGNWSITASSMSDGSHTLTVKAKDAVGNYSSASSSLSVTIDTTAPSTTVSTLAFSDDTGSSSSDFVTSTAKQDISGTLSANLAANETVQISVDNGSTWIDASATVGQNTFTLSKQTLSGTDTMKVRVVDAAGNTGTAKSQAYTIDSSAPSAPSTPDLDAGSDSGSSSTDDNTSDDTPTFSGTAEANATVTLYDTDGVTVLGTTTADGSGNWSITSSTLSEGAHTVSVKATDAAGNVSSASSTLSVTIDTTAPSTTISTVAFSADTGASSTDFITKTAAQTISGTLSANLASGETVQISLDNGATWADASATVGQNTFSLSGQTLSGSDTLKVRVVDTAGNAGTVKSQAYELDTTAPATTVSTVAFSDDTGSSSSDFITSAASQDISGTLSANLASGETVQISLDNGSTWIDASATVGKNTYSLTGQTLTGSDTLKVRVVDTAGNAGTVKSQAYELDTTAPTTTVSTVAFSADTGASSTDFITNTAAQDISGTLSANLASGETVQVSLDNGATWADASATVGKNTFSLTGQTLSASDTLKVRVVDTAGNAGTVKSQAYVLDTTAPTNTIASVAFSADTGVSSSDFITNTAAQDISGTLASNLASGEKVQISLDNGATWQDASATVGKNTFSLTGQTLTASDTMKVRVIDEAGNSGTVDSHDYIYDPDALSSVSVKLDTSSLKAESTAKVTFTFSEKVGNFDNSDITVENGTLSTVSSSDGGLTWSGTFTPTADITDAVNVISVDKSTITDLAGNAGSGTTNSPNYKIDTKRPTVNISMSDSSLKTGDTSTVTFTFSEAVSGFTNADLLIDNGTMSAVSSADGGTTWTATFTPKANVEDSSNLITLDMTGLADSFGNAGKGTADSGNYTIDTKGPTVVITMNDSKLGAGETATVTFTFSEAVSGFTTADVLADNGVLSNLSTADGGVTWTATFTPDKNVTSATNVITVDNTGVKDDAGNAGSGTTDSPNYEIDQETPSATISLSDSNLKIGDTATVTITFNEAVTGFTNADLTIANGTLSSVSSSDGGTTWTATFTPDSDIEDAANVITLDQSGVADAFGNAGTGTSDSSNYKIDTKRPTATITLDDTALKTGDTAKVTITFSEAVTGFTNADLTIANGTLSSVSSSDGGITWTATFTPSSNIEDTSNVITLDNTGVADLAGNAGSGSTDSNNYAIDSKRPTASITLADSKLSIGETSKVTITFSEAVSGFTNADLTIDNGTLSSVSSSDGGVTWSATFTPDSDIEDATNVITLDNSGVVDAAGNAGTGTTDSGNYTIDSKRPTATITLDDTALKAGDTAKVTITFSEAVSGLTNADLTIANGTLTSVSSSDGGVTWSATFTPDSNIEDATNLITLDNSGVADAYGNAGSGTTDSNNYAIDSKRPTATITLDDTALKAGDTAKVTLTFSEAVTGLTNADLTIANGTLSSVSSSDGGVTWSATFTPDSNLEDATNVITLDNSGVTDLAGNAGSGTTDSNNYAIDSKRPTASISFADSKLALGETSKVTITFSEAVSGFTNADLTIENGTLSAVSSSDGGVTWSATFTPDSDIEDATNVITLDNTGVVDAAGNAGTGTTDSGNYTIDSKRPTATITLDDTALKIGDTAKVTITFSEAVSGLTNADLTIANGTLSSVSSSDGGVTWSATFTPSSNIEDATNLITLDNSGVADAYGNAGSGTTDSNNYAIDSKRPTATITLDDTALKAGDTAKVTLTFSEAVTGLTNADLTIANGTLSSVSSSDGGVTWSATFTPDSNIEDATNVITLDNTGVADLAGNAGSGTTDSNNYAIDSKRPTASIALSDSKLALGETSKVTITFSEAVSGFTNADLTIANGTLSAVSSSDGGVTWSATFTPDSDIEDATNVITLDNSGVVDAAGNAGTGTTDSGNYTIDSKRPTATITLDDTALKIGDTAKVTITFSEAVSGLTNADLTIANGTLSSVSSSDGGTTWSATFTPSSNIEDATNLITLDNSGVADAYGNAGSGTTDSNNYAIDSKRPTATITLDDTALKAGDTAKVTLTFSEAVTGLTNADLTIANGTLSSVSSSDGGVTWSATFTPDSNIEDATNVITLDNSGVADLAGNAGSGTTDSNNYAIDSKRPTASIALSDSKLALGETSKVTITFSEAVSGLDAADFSVANGKLSGISSSDGGITWSATLTPDSDIEDATNVITLDNSGVVDAAGNAGTGTTDSGNYTIDSKRPTATITLDDTALKIGDTAKVTITFSEAVSGLTNADLTVANGTLSSVSSSDGGVTWSATFTPSSNLEDATNVITLDNSGVADAYGNAGSGTTDSNNYAIDSKRPTATITLSDEALILGEKATVTFTFSEIVSDFTTADVKVENGALSNLSSKDGGLTWSAEFTPASSVEDASNLMTLDLSGVNDAAGNAGSGTLDSKNYSIDTIAPQISMSSSVSSVGMGETAVITFTLSEASNDFSLSAINVNGGSLSNLSGSGKSYSATFTPAADFAGSATLTISANAFKDVAGNGNLAANSLQVGVDTIKPAITISSDLAKIGPAGGTLHFKLSEASKNFTFDDIQVKNGVLSNFSGSGTDYSATFTPDKGMDGKTEVSVAAGSFSDAQGNMNEAGSVTLLVDTVAPNAKMSSDKALLGANQTAVITITLDEIAAGFNLDSLSADGGKLSNFQGSGTTYTVDFTPLPDANGAASVSIISGKLADALGNVSELSTQVGLQVDTLAPGVKFSSVLSQLKNGESTMVTLTLSEVPSKVLTADLLKVSGGAISGFGGSGQVYTFSFTPSANSTADGVISMAAASFTDAAGNPSQAQELRLKVDTAIPATPGTVSLTPATDSGISNKDGVTNVANPVLTGSAEPGSTVTIFDGAKQIATATAGKDGVWVSNPVPLSEGRHLISVTSTDALGNVSPSSAVSEVVIDRSNPAPTEMVANILPGDSSGNGNSAKADVRGKGEPGSTVRLFENGVEIGTAQVNPGGQWNTVLRLPIGDHNLTAIVTDAAGNESSASQPLKVTVHTPPPRLNAQTPAPVPAPAPAPSPQSGTETSPAPVGTAVSSGGNSGNSGIQTGLNNSNANTPVTNTVAGSANNTPNNSGGIGNSGGANALSGTSLSPAPAPAPAPGPAPAPAPAPAAGERSAPANTSQPGARPASPPASGNTPAQGGANSGAASSSGGAERTLLVNREVNTISADAGQNIAFTIPKDTFLSNSNSPLIFKAALAGDRPGADQPLPAWLKFDPVSGTFSGEPPADAPAVIKIRVVARDANGNEASATFVINRNGAGADSKTAPKPLAARDLLQLLAIKRAPFGVLSADDVAPEEPPQHGQLAEGAQGMQDASLPLGRAAEGGAETASPSMPEIPHAPQFSEQLSHAKQSFDLKGANTLRHLAAVQQMRNQTAQV